MNYTVLKVIMLQETEKRPFFAYLRESVDLDSGIGAQKEKIEKYAEFQNIKILKWYIDNDKSAFKFRPNYDIMMKELPDAKVDGIICTKLSRFGRSVTDTLVEHQKVKALGKELIFTHDSIDTSTAAGRMMFGMLAVFNEFEREIIVERLTSGKEYAKTHGTKSGKPMNRPRISIDWRRYAELRTIGISIPAIAKQFRISKNTLYKAVERRDKGEP